MKLYKRYSPHMQSCDLIEWQSYGSALGWAIRMVTGRNANHTSIVVRPKEYGGFKNRRFLLEALGGGLAVRLLSARLNNYKGRVMWLPLDRAQVTDQQTNIMVEWAIEQCAMGKRYDYSSLFRNVTGRVSVNAERFFCSEYATAMFIKGFLLAEDEEARRPGEFHSLTFVKKPIVIYDSEADRKINNLKERRNSNV